MKKILIAMLLAGPLVPCLAQTPILNSCSGMSLGTNGALNGFVPAPGDAWKTDISAAPVDPNSATIISTSGDLAGAYLHPDFGGYGAGIPYQVVDSRQTPGVPVGITLYQDDSDITLAPIPANAAVEGNPSTCTTDDSDRHLIVLDRNKCVVYEYWQGSYCNSAWSAANTALFDMSKVTKRPYGLTSADAAGLSIFEGLVRYDEIIAGSINHAIRFTAQHTKNDANNGFFAAPATHASGNNWGTHNVIGMRIRLRADFDVSGFSTTNQIILNAMKKYGMMLADNGSNLFFQGTADPRWDDNDLNKLKAVPSSAFEVVSMGPVYDAATAPTGAAPKINSFTASATSVTTGSPVTLTADVTGASYSYVDAAGFYRSPIVVNPTATTTYTLTSRNEFGTSTSSVTVAVVAAVAPGLKLTSAPVSGAQFAVLATSASPGAITYSLVSGPATINGTQVTFTGSGTAVVQASQAATSSYTAATASVSISYTKPALLSPGLKLTSALVSGAQYAVSASSASQGAITYSLVSGPATINGTKVTFTGSGVAVVQASQAATSTYAAATASVTISYTKPALLSPGLKLASTSLSDIQFQVSASSASTGAITYSVLSGPATIKGTQVTFTAAGTAVVSATQAATTTYAAGSATIYITCKKFALLSPGLALSSSVVSGGVYAVSPSTASTGVITYSVVSGPATVSGNRVTFSTGGTAVVQATQAATATYAAATATVSITYSVVKPAVTVAPPTLRLMYTTNGSGQYSIVSASPSTGPISYTVVSGPAIAFSSLVLFTAPGTVTVQATQAATATYPAATASINITYKK